MPRVLYRMVFQRLAWPLVFGVLAAGAAAGKKFTLPLRDDQGWMRTLIEGDSVRAVDGLTVMRLGGLKLTTFKTNDMAEFTAEAPECIYDTKQQAAFSAGTFSGRAVDGRLTLSGRGFEFRASNSVMRVSNDVHTTIRSLTNAPGITNALSIVITSQALNLELGAKRATFSGTVHADEQRMALKAEALIVRIGEQQGTFESLEADRNVVVTDKSDNSRTTAGRALYTRATDMIDLFGNPVWQQGAREARAETMSFHRTNRAFQADGHVALKMPREMLGRGGFLPASLAGPTNTPAVAGTNLVEMFADRLRSVSNLTVAGGSVRLVEGAGKLTCAELTLRQATPESPDDTAVAEGGVTVEQGTSRVSSHRASYSRLAGALAFTGKPEWKLNQMEGRAGTLTLWPQTNAVTAIGDARIKLTPGAGSGTLFPAFPLLTTATASNQPATTSQPATPFEVFAEVVSFTNRTASFIGNVRARQMGTNGGEPRLNCPSVVIQFAALTNRAESATAGGGVILEHGLAGSTNGPTAYQRLDARTLRARMDPATGAMAEMVAEGEVVYRSAQLFAAADRMTYDAKTDTLRLSGEPFLINDQAMVYKATALTVNRRTGEYASEGEIEFKLFVKPGAPMPSANPPVNSPQ